MAGVFDGASPYLLAGRLLSAVDPEGVLSSGVVTRVRCIFAEEVSHWDVSVSFLSGIDLSIRFDVDGASAVHMRSVVRSLSGTSSRFALCDASTFYSSLQETVVFPEGLKGLFSVFETDGAVSPEVSCHDVFDAFKRLLFGDMDGGEKYADRFTGFDALYSLSDGLYSDVVVRSDFSSASWKIVVDYSAAKDQRNVVLMFDCGMNHFVRCDCYLVEQRVRKASLCVAFDLAEQMEGIYGKQNTRNVSLGKPRGVSCH